MVRRFVEEFQTGNDGTHRGPFMGIPPTGKTVRIDLIDIVRVEDGRIAEHWNVVDQLGLMRQLGAIPP